MIVGLVKMIASRTLLLLSYVDFVFELKTKKNNQLISRSQFSQDKTISKRWFLKLVLILWLVILHVYIGLTLSHFRLLSRFQILELYLLAISLDICASSLRMLTSILTSFLLILLVETSKIFH